MTRLQKLLAAAGLGSRRSIEQWIRDGRVSVAGRTAQLGDRAESTDVVCLDGRRLDLSATRMSGSELLLYHKPVGEMTTRRDPQGRPTVFDRLPDPRHGRWVSVGRLDVNTSGLLLLTNDGELAHRLMHPSSGIDREYLVRVRGNPSPSVIDRLRAGVALEDGWAQFDRLEREGAPRPESRAGKGVKSGAGHSAERPGHHATPRSAPGTHTMFRVVLHEGRNREVRRLWSAVGFEVSRLRRIRYGPIELPGDLPPGRWRIADAALITRLAAPVRLSPDAAGGASPRASTRPPASR